MSLLFAVQNPVVQNPVVLGQHWPTINMVAIGPALPLVNFSWMITQPLVLPCNPSQIPSSQNECLMAGTT